MKIAFTILLIFISDFVFAQDSVSYPQKVYKNCFFIELGGAARTVSLNYERALYRKAGENKASLRVGFGGFRRAFEVGGREAIRIIPVLPIEVSVYNSFSNHAVNIGIGIAPTFDKQTFFSFPHGIGIKNEFYMTYFARIGYLFQGTKGLLIKVAFMPLLTKAFESSPNYVLIGYTRKLIPWAGLSIGQSF